MSAIRIKNWSKFQHFKDRRPPWVKLYRDLLDDRDWHKLDGEAAKMLVNLWLIGSESDGLLPSIEDLAFRLRVSEQHVDKCLKKLSDWLISERYQDDINVSQQNSATEFGKTVADIEVPLRERDREETETETEKRREPPEPEAQAGRSRSLSVKDLVNLGVNAQIAADWLKIRKVPLTATALAAMRREASKAGITISDAVTICAEKGWRGFNAGYAWKAPSGPQEALNGVGQGGGSGASFLSPEIAKTQAYLKSQSEARASPEAIKSAAELLRMTKARMGQGEQSG